MILPLLGEKLHGPAVTLAGLECPTHGEVVQLRIEHTCLAADPGRRVGIGIGDQRVPVEAGEPPVHGRVRREPRLQGEDLAGQIVVALFDRVEARLGAQHREPRRPDVGGDQVAPFARLKRDLQKVAGIEPQNGTAVGIHVADPCQAILHALGLLQVRGVDEMVDLAGAAVLLVDG